MLQSALHLNKRIDSKLGAEETDTQAMKMLSEVPGLMTLGQHRIRIGKGIRNFPEKRISNGKNGDDSCKRVKFLLKI